jgi:thiamine-monophosphate kinase
MMTDKAADLSGEERLIARYFRPLASHPGALGLDDDAAALMPPQGCDLVLKTDGLIGGVHFFPDDPADAVAKKALRVNLSDLAAKGARPLGFLLALALPQETGATWLELFARGLGEDADFFRCPLLGGDTDKTPGPITISIAALGTVEHGRMIRRSGAVAGDRVVVTGTIGDAALGLLLRGDPTTVKRWNLNRRQHDHLIARYLIPEPRTTITDLLRAHATAAMDVSDGLVGDLAKLCRASNAAAEIEIERVPSRLLGGLLGSPSWVRATTTSSSYRAETIEKSDASQFPECVMELAPLGPCIYYVWVPLEWRQPHRRNAWPGPPPFSLRSASVSRSTATCQPNSDHF